MASLDLPSRPYPPGHGQSASARTSITHIDMPEVDNAPRIVEEPEPLVPPTEQAEQKVEPNGLKTGSPGGADAQLVVPPHTPQVYITFLVISGQRRAMSFEPETTLGRVKELVWNTWPADWEGDRPLAPSYLRVLYLGKMLQDDDTLAKLKFPVHTSQSAPANPTIVHLSVRPFAPPTDDMKKKRNRTRSSDAGMESASSHEGNDVNTGCCACIIC